MTETAENLARFLKGGGSHVMGAVVMWALSGVRAPRAELREALENIGLGKACPKDPRPTRLLGKAVDASRAGARGYLFRGLGKERWAIVQESQHQLLSDDPRLAHEHCITLRIEEREQVDGEKYHVPVFDRLGDAVPTRALELAQAVVDHYEEARQFANTEDLSLILTTAMGGTAVSPMLGAVSLREGTGGVYFVPGASVDTVLQLRALVDDLAGASHVTALTLYGDASNLAEAALAARSSFTAKLNELKGELATFVAGMKAKDGAFTDKHVQTRVDRLGALRDRVEMWDDALGDVRLELQDSIKAAQAGVAEAMGL